jgi:hypothetical protein
MTTGDSTHAWIAIQNMLTAAANASKALWGQGGRLSEQREPLRASIRVNDTSPLREVVMRDHFEHYDERLDRWWENSEAHNYLDMSVMPPSMVQGVADGDMFRVFDPSTGDVVFWGQRFRLTALAEEAVRLLPIATAEARKPHWEPPSAAGGGQ